MSLNFPTSQRDVYNRISADIQSELPTAGSFLKNSFINAMSVAFSGRSFDNYLLLNILLLQMFPDTATEEFALQWGSYVSTYKLPASGSHGYITVPGLNVASVPIDTEVQTQDGILYTAETDASIGLQLFSITTLIRSGNTVTATTSTDHTMATGMLVEIEGADQAAYNGEFTITVTDSDKFIYNIQSGSSPASPATGTIDVFYYGATVLIASEDVGASTNLDAGTQLNLVGNINGVNNEVYVQWGGIKGGTDVESDENYKKRYLERYRNPVALFNIGAIEAQAKEVQGVTRVFVKPVTPYVGAVTVYFMRDDDPTPIPTSQHISDVRNHLLVIKPATVLDSDVFVYAPTPVPVNFVFTSLLPNTVSMQEAVKASLQDLFKESTEVEKDLLEAAYQSAIYQTVDLNSGSTVESFGLSSPSGDVSIGAGEIPVLGNVTFT